MRKISLTGEMNLCGQLGKALSALKWFAEWQGRSLKKNCCMFPSMLGARFIQIHKMHYHGPVTGQDPWLRRAKCSEFWGFPCLGT